MGKRTAQRLQLELGQHLTLEGSATETGALRKMSRLSMRLREVHEALAMLGYGPDEVRRATKDLDETALHRVATPARALNLLAPTR